MGKRFEGGERERGRAEMGKRQKGIRREERDIK